MSSTPVIGNAMPPKNEHCHHTQDPFMPLLKKITAVALIAFSAYTAFSLFVPAFFAGVAIGIFQNLYREKKSVDSIIISSCAHGFLEQTTGVQLPEMISLIGGAALYYCHIEHHPEVCVPLSGLIGGVWAVELIAKLAKQPRQHAVESGVRWG